MDRTSPRRAGASWSTHSAARPCATSRPTFPASEAARAAVRARADGGASAGARTSWPHGGAVGRRADLEPARASSAIAARLRAARSARPRTRRALRSRIAAAGPPADLRPAAAASRRRRPRADHDRPSWSCLPFEETTLVRPDFASRPARRARGRSPPSCERVEKLKVSFDSLSLPGASASTSATRSIRRCIAALTGAVRSASGPRTGATAGGGRDPGHDGHADPEPATPRCFLVHDIWGHGWEEIAVRLRVVVRAAHAAARSVAGRQLDRRGPRGAARSSRCATPSRWSTAGADAGPDTWRTAVVRADLRGRITIALNVVVAECLADLVEHKYVRRRPAEAPALPSSSLLPEAPPSSISACVTRRRC